MEGDNRQTYQGLKQYSLNENNVYELCQTSRNGERKVEVPKDIKETSTTSRSTNKEMSKPIIVVIIVLLSLIVILLVGIFCLMLFQVINKDTASTTVPTTGATTGASTSSSGSSPGAVDDILLIAQELYNASTTLPTTCEQLKRQHQTTQSGFYILASANGSTTYTAYCEMYELCGSTGWMRLASLNLYRGSCPSGFRLYQSGSRRACGRPVTNSGSCVSVQFSSNGISYSQICGRITGYQYGSTDAVDNLSSSYRNDLNSYYVDGVSITRGSPRQHVWTLMAGESEVTNSSGSCPCNTGSTASVQSFIGNNYFCESGNDANSTSSTLYTPDQLWDGSGFYCRSLESSCCDSTDPWFHRDYGSTIPLLTILS